MKKQLLYLLTCVLALPLTACSQNGPLLSGKITLRKDWRPTLYLVKPAFYKQLISSFEGDLVDSAELAPDGSFAFRNISSLDKKGLYLLYIQPAGSRFYTEIASPLPAENYICLALAPGAAIRLEANAWELARSYRLEEADPESRLIAQLRDLREPLYRKFEQHKATDDSPGAVESADHVVVSDKVINALDIFLDTTQAVLPAFAALRLRAPDNEFRDQPELFLRVLDRLQTLDPGDPWVDQLGVFLDRSRLPVLRGEAMPDFALPEPDGDTVHPASLHAKLLLVDFWASWCEPCRLEMRETLRPLYNQYHGRGFNVIGVSIDRSRDAWTTAIRKEGAEWPNVSDLLGDASPVRQSLKFEYIPANYLLDADGRLLARNLHGEELRIFVERYIGAR